MKMHSGIICHVNTNKNGRFVMGKEGGPLHLFYDFTDAMFLGKLYLSLAAFPETNLTMSVTEGKMFME